MLPLQIQVITKIGLLTSCLYHFTFNQTCQKKIFSIGTLRGSHQRVPFQNHNYRKYTKILEICLKKGNDRRH